MTLLPSIFPRFWPGREHDEQVQAEMLQEASIEEISEMHDEHDYETVMLMYPGGERRAAVYCKSCQCIHSAKVVPKPAIIERGVAV